MGMMIVRHRVRDYGQWRPIFDQHAEMQRAAGLINPRVYHSAEGLGHTCPLWVISGNSVTLRVMSVLLIKQTFISVSGTSAMCHKQTAG